MTPHNDEIRLESTYDVGFKAGAAYEREQNEIEIQQLKGALGEPIPDGILENPEIKNPLANFIQKELAAERERAAGLVTGLEVIRDLNPSYRVLGEAQDIAERVLAKYRDGAGEGKCEKR